MDGAMKRIRDLQKQRSYERAWYARNADKVKRRVKDQRQVVIDWFHQYKATLSCNRCGENDPVCLDFHHRDPTQKVFSIHQTARKAIGKARILAEIAKCDVLCANCHRKLHRDLRDQEMESRDQGPCTPLQGRHVLVEQNPFAGGGDSQA
jgi:hypothetical protein